MQAIILAGGFGTRLQSVVTNVPKVMAPVAGRPFLHWLLEHAQRQGISEVTLCVHHMNQVIRNYFGDRFGSLRIHYSIEKEPLGTGGAMRRAMATLTSASPVFIFNGDSLVDVDYRDMIMRHIDEGQRLTMAIRHVDDCSRFSQLRLCQDWITRFDLLGSNEAGTISAGFYIASPKLFEEFDLPEHFSFERDFLAPYVPQLLPAAYDQVRYFIDIGVPADYARAQVEIPQRLRMQLAA